MWPIRYFKVDQSAELTADIEQPIIEPNYNICPKDNSPVIHYDSDNLAITSMQWGLRPSWSKESTMEPINARIETIDSKPMFREAYRQRRCLVPANGWYEWKTTPRGKVPFYHSAENKACLAHGWNLRTLGRRRTIVEHIHNTHSRIDSRDSTYPPSDACAHR